MLLHRVGMINPGQHSTPALPGRIPTSRAVGVLAQPIRRLNAARSPRVKAPFSATAALDDN